MKGKEYLNQQDFSIPSIRKLCEHASANDRGFYEANQYGIENYHARIRHYGMVYIINVGENYYKIGRTTSIWERMKAFRRSNPYVRDSSQVLALIYAKASENPGLRRFHPKWPTCDLETYIHQILRAKSINSDNTHKPRGPKEIFRLDEEDLKSLFAILMENSTLEPPRRGNAKQTYYKLKEIPYTAKPGLVGGFVPREIVDRLAAPHDPCIGYPVHKSSARLPGDGLWSEKK